MTELGLGIDPAAAKKLTEAQAASQVDTKDAESDIGSTIETVIYSIDYAAEVLADLLD